MRPLRIEIPRNQFAIVVLLALIWECISLVAHRPWLFPSWEYLLRTSLPSFGVFSDSSNPTLANGIIVIAQSSLITFVRILIGLALGIPMGIIAGLIFHFLRGEGPLSVMMLIFLRSAPLLALIPLFSFWFGASESGILLYIAFGIFVIALSDSYEAAANISPDFLYQAHLLGGRSLFVIRTIYLPAIGQQLRSTIRNVVGLSWVFALGAEYISAQSGLGYIAYQSYLYADMGKLVILCICYMVLGSVTAEVATRIISTQLPWTTAKGLGGV